jgi:flagellum-specific peptidoglycan hydrolase FlgJ
VVKIAPTNISPYLAYQANAMKVHLPLPRDWRLFAEELFRRFRRQLISPWTKLALLVVLTIVVTRKEFSFSISVNQPLSVFSESVPTPAAGATLATFASADRNWTAREIEQLSYVSTYRDLALRQQREHGIPASITLAQGLLESGIGKSTLAVRNNNHYGLKCFSRSCQKGHCSNHSDDHHKDFFRIFDSPAESYLAHAKLLQKDRYRPLFRLSATDYRGWARGLSKAGYATDPRYADKLIRLIERLQLHRLDTVS